MALYSASGSVIRHPDDGITIIDSGAATQAMSLVRARLHGRHVGPPNRRSSTAYFVISGSARITLDGEEFDLTAGDTVIAEPNVRRELTGDAELIIVNTPPFDPQDEQPR